MQDLLEQVVEQIKLDIENENIEAIEELLAFIPKEKLEGFLPQWDC